MQASIEHISNHSEIVIGKERSDTGTCRRDRFSPRNWSLRLLNETFLKKIRRKQGAVGDNYGSVVRIITHFGKAEKAPEPLLNSCHPGQIEFELLPRAFKKRPKSNHPLRAVQINSRLWKKAEAHKAV